MLRIACADLLGKMDVEQVCSGLLGGLGGGAAGRARVRAARGSRADATGPARRDRDGSAGRRRAGLRQRRGRPVRLRAAARRLGSRGHQVRHDGGRDRPAASSAARARTRPWWSTPTCARKGGPARSSARWPPIGQYYARWSEVWEAQALVRARPVAGDADLGRRFIELIDPIRYPDDGLTPAQVTEIRRIKARVDAERLPRGADRTTHTKLGYGGLADVERTVQLLQLQHAGDIPELRTTGTLDGLREAAEADLITPRRRRRSWPRVG